MAASASDYFHKVGDSTATTLSAPGYTIGGTSINVGSTTNWPTDTGVTFAIDEVDADGVRVPGTYNTFRGVVSSGTQISSLTYVGGDANRNYSAGATTRVYIHVGKDRENRFVDGVITEHAQDGTHKSAIITSRTADTAPASGDLLLSSDISDSNNLKKITIANLLANNATSLGGAWISYTPTLAASGGSPTIGNGTLTASYIQIGKTVHFKVRIVRGSTTNFGTGTCTLTLPVTANESVDAYNIIGAWGGLDLAPAAYAGLIHINSTTTFVMGLNHSTAAAGAQVSFVTNTVPFTWATGDIYHATGTYEAA